ncbi:chromogranin-A-like isoform X2 [Brienomyrus brachyistius]|uniref:chromogranin-A-like isoform X2 n=1 Tax=Brienomyrus brachyistius TaxID=42636 RepID=UPI0020B3FEA9|nr:chromogranin-A-like isoform X2 [Brienomyrus brachyistius]XP_048856550.1 chromogranin-A-like isoform X2 [Brienomyrus brachyistius]
MTTRACVVFALIVNYVVSLPVTSNHMDNKDVKVMKCIVEVIVDVLSIHEPKPVSLECLDTLRADERLIFILRHQNFLKELQDIAAQGATERANQKNAIGAGHMFDMLEYSQGSRELADQSMLVALRVAPTEKREARLDVTEMFASKESEEPKGKEQESGQNQNLVIRTQEEDKHGPKQRGKTSSEEAEEDQVRSAAGEYKMQADTGHKLESSHKAELKVGKHTEKEEKEVAKKEDAERSPEGLDSEAEGDEEEEDEEEEIKHWNRIGKMTEKSSLLHVGRDDTSTTGEQPMALDLSHHSKEDSEEQIHELQMMARREPTERREDDGSGSRKAEDQEIESLAAIELELESVTQKLHKLRRG